jgi:hypothetical protein
MPHGKQSLNKLKLFADAGDKDVALLCGHGAQENLGFPEEQDGLLECMVCYARCVKYRTSRR